MSRRRGSVTEVYRKVIDDVVDAVRAEFAAQGLDEAILRDMKAIWEGKMVGSGVVSAQDFLEDGGASLGLGSDLMDALDGDVTGMDVGGTDAAALAAAAVNDAGVAAFALGGGLDYGAQFGAFFVAVGNLLPGPVFALCSFAV